MKALIFGMLLIGSIGTSMAATERCQVASKSAPTSTSVGSRSNVSAKGVSFRDCFQKATDMVRKNSVGDSLMMKHTSRADIVKIIKMEQSTSEDFDQYFLY